jgi:toxin ParE1/3/4
MKFVISPHAENDIDNIASYIAVDNPERAVSFAIEIRQRFRVIAERPLSFPEKAEWGRGKRSSLIGKYHILFEVKDEVVQIQRVMHGARDIGNLIG